MTKLTRTLVKRYKIPPRTKKRLSREKQYKLICNDLDEKLKEQRKFDCFFCGEKIKPNQPYQHHHLKGREEDLLTESLYIVVAHLQCHYDYHNTSCKKIYWFWDYIKRVYDKDEELGQREEFKLSK